MNVHNNALLCVLALSAVVASPCRAADQSACKITINTPAAGGTVGRSGIAEGAAVLPPGSFPGRTQDSRGERMWPQGGGPRLLEERGAWSVHVNYGERPDIGSDLR